MRKIIKKNEMEDKKLTLAGHLDELRGRILKSVFAIIVISCVSYSFVDKIIPNLVKPAGKLVFIAPQEAFLANIKIAFFAGFLLASPIVLYQIWRFISSGLNKTERKYTLVFAPLSFIFFMFGAFFGYCVIAPIGIKFLLGFSTEFVMPMITISRYISFVGMLTLVFGAVFELPLVSLFLTKIGVVTPRFLSSTRKQAIVFIFIAAAILTPPDVVTQTLMAVPLLVLYEIGIIFSKLAYKPMQTIK